MIDNKKIRDLVKDVFKSNDEYSLTQKFEEEFCEKFGVKYAVSINSATSSLTLETHKFLSFNSLFV